MCEPLVAKKMAGCRSGCGFDTQKCFDGIYFAAHHQSDYARHIRQCPQTLYLQHQRAGIDAAAVCDNVPKCQRMFRHLRDKLRRFGLEWLNDPADDRNACRAHLFALIARYTIKYAGACEGSLDFLRIIARVECSLRQLDERGRADKIGQIAKPDHRTSRVAAHTADAVERLRGILHLLMRKWLWKMRISGRAFEPRFQAGDLVFVRVLSTTRSRITGRFRSGSIVIAGSTASQQARTSRPFIRTAQVPHILEPQNQR